MRLWKRICVHYTSVHGNWLNQAKVEVRLLSRQCLSTQRLPSVETLQVKTKAWEQDANHCGVHIRWAFTVSKAHRTFRYHPTDFIRAKDLLCECDGISSMKGYWGLFLPKAVEVQLQHLAAEV